MITEGKDWYQRGNRRFVPRHHKYHSCSEKYVENYWIISTITYELFLFKLKQKKPKIINLSSWFWDLRRRKHEISHCKSILWPTLVFTEPHHSVSTDLLALRHDTRICTFILNKVAYVFISGPSFSFFIITFCTLFCRKFYELRSFRLRFFDVFLTPNFRNSLVHKFSPSLTSYLCLNWFVWNSY